MSYLYVKWNRFLRRFSRRRFRLLKHAFESFLTDPLYTFGSPGFAAVLRTPRRSLRRIPPEQEDRGSCDHRLADGDCL